MLMSCSRCGRVHERQFICEGKKRNYQKKLSLADKFRNTQAWRNKKRDIVHRDRALCLVCMSGAYPSYSSRPLNQKVQVHHIIPINEDYTRRLDGDNLICLCTYHHHMAEHGQIKRKELIELVRVSEEKLI